ncbi:MAG: flagellar biosynthesis protein FlgL [Sphingomonadales bacterium]|nr:flagellar biosynthesis protein FlgL [Sphingomonadales bacterium]
MTTVSTSAFYDRVNLDISTLRSRAEALQASIGSGQRLTRSSDDPVGAARLRTLSRADTFSAIDLSIAARASSDLRLTDSALQSFAATTIRAQELATQAANGILTPAQRNGIAIELNQIGKELVRLANTRDSADNALFGGETTGDAYGFSPGGTLTYLGTATAGELPLGDGQSVVRGLTGPEVFEFDAGGGPTNLYTVIKTLADALGGVTPGVDPIQAARDAMGALETGLETIATQQTIVGTRLNWIDLNTERRTQMSELRAEEQADVGGTDLAEAMSRLQQTMTVLEASQASFARLSSLSLFEFLR